MTLTLSNESMVDYARGKHRNEKRSWHSLRLFLLYRIGLAALLLILFYLDRHNDLGVKNKSLYLSTTYALLSLNLLLTFPTYLKWLSFRWLVFIMAGADILALTMLVHSSAGLSGGLALLIIPSIAGVGLLLPGRMALFFAAIAALAILGELVYGTWTYLYWQPNYTMAGIHGMLYFAIASLAAKLARRVKESEATVTELDKNLTSVTEMNEQIIDNMQSGVCVVGDDGRVRLINQTAQRLLGASKASNTLRLADLSDSLYTSFSVWRKRRDDRTYEHNAITESGSDFEARFIQAGEGKQTVTLIFLQDISERNRQLQAMKLASLGRFTASIAHEIRNPLGAISHATQLLQESPSLKEEDMRLVEITETNTKRMNHIIEDILNLSRRNPSSPETISLYSWLQKLLAEYRQQKLTAENELQMHFTASDKTVTFDANQLRQVLWNLLNNAQSHGHSDQKTVTIKLKGDIPDNATFAYIDIINDGAQISEENAKQLFEPFFTTSNDGTGLGLYLSRELCENNGGSLDYVKQSDGKTCFRIKLPITHVH